MHTIGRTILQHNCVVIVIKQLILWLYISLFKVNKYINTKRAGTKSVMVKVNGVKVKIIPSFKYAY